MPRVADRRGRLHRTDRRRAAILGLCTRPVAFVLAGEMAFAYFIGHFPKGFHPLINGGTLAILYCFTCLYLSTAGASPWSIDAKNNRA